MNNNNAERRRTPGAVQHGSATRRRRSCRIALLAAAALAALGAAGQAFAVASPGAILWTYPPESFVTSLYNGVLGRAPESGAVVAGWAAQATTPQGKWRVFWGFINSPEYRGKYGGVRCAEARDCRGRGDWTVYYRRNRWDTSYTVAQQIPNGYHGVVYGPYKYSVAIALRNFLAAFYTGPYRQR